MRLRYVVPALLVAWLLSLLPAQAGSWQLLGERTVNFKTDRDVIRVTASEGLFTKFKLRVQRNGVEILDLKVVFGDGSSHDYQVRRFIAAGGETRILDIPGKARVIKKVELVYRSRKVGKKAVIKLYGMAVGPSVSEQPGTGSPPSAATGWRKLGERSVNFAADRDVIRVGSDEGTFSRIKLKVVRRGINLLDLKVHFGNGETFDVSVRKLIPAGGETRVIDLPGTNRVIKKVELVYRSGGRGRGKAQVSLWGT